MRYFLGYLSNNIEVGITTVSFTFKGIKVSQSELIHIPTEKEKQHAG